MRALLLAACVVSPAWAADEVLMPADRPSPYVPACGGCHVAYAPGLLPAASWQRLLSGLSTHFGRTVSLAPATVTELSTWLQAHARRASSGQDASPQDRITTTAWFTRTHRKVDASVWSHASVRTPGNCAACHAQASAGRFDDDVLLPAGLSARQRRSLLD